MHPLMYIVNNLTQSRAPAKNKKRWYDWMHFGANASKLPQSANSYRHPGRHWLILRRPSSGGSVLSPPAVLYLLFVPLSASWLLRNHYETYEQLASGF